MRDVVMGILERYLPGRLKPTGDGNVITTCPFHKGGQERKPSFGVIVDKGIYNCFTCHESGDMRKMLVKLGVSIPQINYEVEPIAAELKENRKVATLKINNFHSSKDPFLASPVLPESLLGVYEYIPTTLLEAGFDQSLLQSLHIGLDLKSNRIMYPIRDVYGNLAGFSGGAIEKGINPKYKVYQGLRKGQKNEIIPGDFGSGFDELYPTYRFENHNYLWNYHNAWKSLRGLPDGQGTLYIAEGFKACMWLIQSGFPNSVALMGTSMSETQQRLIHRLGVTVVLCLDNDEAGRRATYKIGRSLLVPMKGRIKVANYPVIDEDGQPDDYPSEHVHQIVNHHATPFSEYKRSVFNANVRT